MARKDKYEGVMTNAIETFYPSPKKGTMPAVKYYGLVAERHRKNDKRWARAMKTMWVDSDHKDDENKAHYEENYQKFLREKEWQDKKKKKKN